MITISSPFKSETIPVALALNICPESSATLFSIPVPISGACGLIRGTACLCMLEPIRALFASSCSKNGINAVDTDTICIGDTSI